MDKIKKITIYVIDDEPDLCELFSELFAHDRVEICTFTNPSVAVEETKRRPPHLFFIDFRLPGTNGDTVAQQLPAEVPKYLITGDLHAKTTYVFSGVLTKPFKVEVIKGVIDTHLRKHLGD